MMLKGHRKKQTFISYSFQLDIFSHNLLELNLKEREIKTKTTLKLSFL